MGSLKRSSSYWLKRCRNRSPEKGNKNPPRRSRKAFFATSTCAPKISQIFACPEKKKAKNAIFETSSVLQPAGLLFCPKDQFGQIFNFEKNCNRRESYSQKRSAKIEQLQLDNSSIINLLAVMLLAAAITPKTRNWETAIKLKHTSEMLVSGPAMVLLASDKRCFHDIPHENLLRIPS